MASLVAIVGPTATGKTAKAVELFHEQPSILVSADSRQVYRGMDIVTGKDHPQHIPMLGIDIVGPDEPCSVSVWYDSVISHLEDALAGGKQVIVVGGTGLYVKALTSGIATMQVPVDQSLREELSPLSITKLQQKLGELDPAKLDTMNHSDSLNPRRLIRAIEVASYPATPLSSRVWNLESSMIGLKYLDERVHQDKIRSRVLSRIDAGAIQETQSLLGRYAKNIQSMSAIGYKSIIKYLEKEYSYEQMVESWISDELAYAKRQLTWFRKQPVIWYDVDKIGA